MFNELDVNKLVNKFSIQIAHHLSAVDKNFHQYVYKLLPAPADALIEIII